MNVTVKVSVSESGKPDYANEVYASQAARDAVLFDFNPSTNKDVTDIKALCAGLIELMIMVRDNPEARPAQKRAAAIAITELEGVQMRCVKALFAK